MKQLNSRFDYIIATLAISLFCFSATAESSQDSFDQEAQVIHLKKIRDEDRNYLKETTINTAKHISKSGEFLVKPYKARVTGPVMTITSPQFQFERIKSGMSASKIASTGLSIASDVGGLFGFKKEASKAREAEYAVRNNSEIFDSLKDGEKIKVTLQAQIQLIDYSADIEILRTIKTEKLFESKEEFNAEKPQLFQQAILGQVTQTLFEFVEEPQF